MSGAGIPDHLLTNQSDDPSGRRAIEVAAMLGDSVVAVQHLTNPRGGRVTRFTRGLFVVGALGIVNAAIAVAHGMSAAAENQVALNEWVEVLKRSPLDFRPTRLAASWEAMMLVGLVGAVVCLAWGAARLMDERRSPAFRIGRAAGVEFPTESLTLPGDSFPLVAPHGDDFVFTRAKGMIGELALGGRITPLDQLPDVLPIPIGARIRVEAGPNTFIVASVPAPARQRRGLLLGFEGAMLAFFAGSAAVHLALLLLVFSVPPDAKTISFEDMGKTARLDRYRMAATDEPKQLEQLELRTKSQEPEGGSGTREAGEQGKMGSKDSKRTSGRYAIEKRSDVPTLAKQAVAIDAAIGNSMIGALRASGSSFQTLTGTGEIASGFDDRDVYGGLIGDEPGAMAGGWGTGTVGFGPGGGGTGLNTLGLGGRYGVIGKGGDGFGPGYGIGGRGKGPGGPTRDAKQPVVSMGKVNPVGDLDRAIVRRYIQQKLPQIQHCYERALVTDGDLAGTVTASFLINPQGGVVNSRAGGIGNDEIEACVATVIGQIQFPRPPGGGVVNVSYPFMFRPAGN